jgi:hypothetical protein
MIYPSGGEVKKESPQNVPAALETHDMAPGQRNAAKPQIITRRPDFSPQNLSIFLWQAI